MFQRMQRNVIENDFLADGYSQQARGQPRTKPNPSAMFMGQDDGGFQVELQDRPERDNGGIGRQGTGEFGGGR